MGAKERRKGNEAERAVVAILRDHGWQAVTSRSTNGTQDGMDVITDAPVAIEVKNHVKLDLSSWLKQAADNAMEKIPLVWHKKKGESNPEHWYVTMEGTEFLKLLDLVRKYTDDIDGNGE
jgi:Holliday junction resolvase-like predicted endonuclease